MAAVLAGACAAPTGTTWPIGAAPTTTPATGSPTVAHTPKPTLNLPPVTDLASTGALVIRANPSPDFAFVAGGFLYVSGVDKGIGKIDSTGKVRASWTIPGDSCQGLDVGFGAVWSATCKTPPGLVRIDVATDELTPIDIGGKPPDSESSVGAGEGAVWMIVDFIERHLIKVDPATNAVVARYAIPGYVSAVRAGLGAVWIADPQASTIQRFDPVTGTVVATIEVGRRPQFLTVGEGAVWTMNQSSGTISRIDPAANTVVATIELGEYVQGGDIAVGGGFLWLRGSSMLLFKIDPTTNQIVARYGPASGSGSVAADDDAVWITAHDITTIWRLPLR